MAQLFYSLLALSSSFFITVSPQAHPVFALYSTSFADRQTIPNVYTCDGKDISPALSWSGSPAKTKSFALICQDPDAPAGVWYHWVVYNIPAALTGIPESGMFPAGAQLGKNSWGRTQYNGPCPPRSSIHRYIFTLYALDTQLNLPSGASVPEVERAMQGHILGKASMLGVFGH